MADGKKQREEAINRISFLTKKYDLNPNLIEHIATQFNVIETHKQKKGILINVKNNKDIPITEDTYIVSRIRRKKSLLY